MSTDLIVKTTWQNSKGNMRETVNAFTSSRFITNNFMLQKQEFNTDGNELISKAKD